MTIDDVAPFTTVVALTTLALMMRNTSVRLAQDSASKVHILVRVVLE